MYRLSTRPGKFLAFMGSTSLVAFTGLAQAAGFGLSSHGASGLGNAYAGAAAVSADTSTVWFNPAGMSEIDGREVSGTLHILNSNSKWTDRGTTLGAAVGSAVASGPSTAEPGTDALIPNFYYVAPINDKWRYGLSIGSPFGSSTEYDNNWKGRYTTVKSGIRVIDINPAVSFKVSEKVRLGFGLSLQQLSAELGSAVDSGAVCFGLANSATINSDISQADCFNVGLTPGNQGNDGYAEITGDSLAVGFNMGALFLPREGVKIGVAYRHSTNHELEGDGNFDVNPLLSGVLAGATGADPASQFFLSNIFRDVPAKAKVELPASFSISGAWQTTDKVQLLADFTHTGWSSFEELRVVFDNPAQRDTVSVQEWENTFRISAGVNFQHSDKLVLRAGLAFDEEAIPSPQRRTARIPGNDRTWYSIGAGYQFSKNLALDVGYARLALDDTPIDNSDPESQGTGQVVRGVFEGAVNYLSTQLNWKFN